MNENTEISEPLNPQLGMSRCYKLFELSEFSSYMINYRNDLKISLRTAAKQIGISASNLSRIEHKKFTPDLESYYKCCKWMQYPMEYFFNSL